MFLIEKIKLKLFRKKWRKFNKHNFTAITNFTDISKIKVGNFTYGAISTYIFKDKSKLQIGNFCSIGPDVTFLLSVDHPTNLLSTYPFKAKILNDGPDAISKGDIIIDDDVWIGYGATILSGVHIGQGAIIAAGAVVTKNVPPYAIVGGVPAKVIKFRFEPEIVEKLLKIDYCKINQDFVKNNKDLFYEPITIENVDRILEKLNIKGIINEK